MSNQVSNVTLSDKELVDLIVKRFLETKDSQTVVILPMSGDSGVKDLIIDAVHSKVRKYLSGSPVSKDGAQIFFPVFMGDDKELLNEYDSQDLLIVVLESEDTPKEVIKELQESFRAGAPNQSILLQG